MHRPLLVRPVVPRTLNPSKAKTITPLWPVFDRIPNPQRACSALPRSGARASHGLMFVESHTFALRNWDGISASCEPCSVGDADGRFSAKGLISGHCFEDSWGEVLPPEGIGAWYSELDRLIRTAGLALGPGRQGKCQSGPRGRVGTRGAYCSRDCGAPGAFTAVGSPTKWHAPRRRSTKSD